MQNYYDLLQVPRTASASEIEAKLDDQYQKWKALVTHHDNNIAMQANQALQTIEQMRSTLLDPASRFSYDVELDKELANSGGLADPNIAIAQPAMAPVFGIPTMGTGSTAAIVKPGMLDRTDAWICPNPDCKKANPIGTTFCANCGETLAKNCPNCGALVEASNKFCSNCGVDRQSFFEESKKAELQALREQHSKIEQLIQEAENNPTAFAKNHKELTSNTGLGCGSYFVFFLIFIGIGNMILNLSDNISIITILSLLITAGLFFGYKYFLTLSKGKRVLTENLLPQLKRIEGQIEEVRKREY
ncbi:MAG: zinc ribbon domain-containing protein [Anaerolineaceae bacterium]|nr:zinc ribbon domain-containing protein [Anaerolineaceae bacterium]